jgi:hypothetical protein
MTDHVDGERFLRTAVVVVIFDADLVFRLSASATESGTRVAIGSSTSLNSTRPGCS